MRTGGYWGESTIAYDEGIMPQPRILLVDDDLSLLEGLRLELSDAFEIDVTPSPAKALQLLAGRPGYGALVVDWRMEEMGGAALLDRARAVAPDTVRIVLTGYADAQTALDAVNKGKVFSVLAKPCPTNELRESLEAALQQYRLVRSEKELLNGSVRGVIKLLSELLSLANPVAFGKATRVRRLAMDIGQYMGLSNRWKLDVAAMLSQIGLIALPDICPQATPDVAKAGPTPSAAAKHAEIASELIAHIPRFKEVAEIIRYQNKRYDGQGPPKDERMGEELPLESRILKVALDYDTLEAALLNAGKNGDKASTQPGDNAAERILAAMQRRRSWYDPKVLESLDSMIHFPEGFEPSFLPLSGLKPGMLLDQTVTSSDGASVFVKGLEVNKAVLQRLKAVARKGGIPEPVRVLVPPKDALLVSELMEL
jgi:response regulator RpfG family c-di-GMP phosphodiesterase